MTTSTFEGAQAALSLYRTENVMVVDGVPVPGEAFPALRIGAGCDAPLQLAAATCSLVRGRRTRAMAIATARMAVRAVSILVGLRRVMGGWLS
jgi:hypothetical protein